ncbi:PPPDE peptidase family protein [Schizosaccharomyces japonicus yFS275]|uniref:PPPDE peptidase family protein n=1 Tax=Schizosaccharomyces japonicus (strain yFS275 / FY16936) TaxID=402676 RepID=B6JXI4_SCHJY|nr:PPPDE peptidase family protein [Schizosaccharomyces japonicus yFS275]EEB05128.1 PPPDE peptidase family protein [Schizosaccharomyces japonicus yFS275]
MEVYINVYDIYLRGFLSNMAWSCGTGVYHSGFVIDDKEFAYGAHEIPDKTGVFILPPKTELENLTWRCRIDLPPCELPRETVTQIIAQLCEEFQGTAYSLLERNCNHFTDAMAFALTGQHVPSYLNRVARIGVKHPQLTKAVLDFKVWLDSKQNDESDSDDDEIVLIPSASRRKLARLSTIQSVPRAHTRHLRTSSNSLWKEN